MATATATVQAQRGLDAREWDEAADRQGILRERDLSCRTLFRAVFYDQRDEPDPEVLLAAASSDGPSCYLPTSPPPPPTAPPRFLSISKALGVHGLQYQKIMPLQLANRSILHICILSHCLKKASSTPASYVHFVLILLVECLIPYGSVGYDFLHYASFKHDGSLFTGAGDTPVLSS